MTWFAKILAAGRQSDTVTPESFKGYEQSLAAKQRNMEVRKAYFNGKFDQDTNNFQLKKDNIDSLNVEFKALAKEIAKFKKELKSLNNKENKTEKDLEKESNLTNKIAEIEGKQKDILSTFKKALRRRF